MALILKVGWISYILDNQISIENEASRFEGFINYLKMLHYIDNMCNQSKVVIGDSYSAFVDQYFEINFSLWWYFMSNYPTLYPHINTLLWRQMKQVYGIDLSQHDDEIKSDKTTPNKQDSAKLWINQEETAEIDNNLQSMHQVPTVTPLRLKIPDLYDLTKIIGVIANHPVYKIFKSKDYESIAKILHKDPHLMNFLEMINKRISHSTTMLISNNFFEKYFSMSNF